MILLTASNSLYDRRFAVQSSVLSYRVALGRIDSELEPWESKDFQVDNHRGKEGSIRFSSEEKDTSSFYSQILSFVLQCINESAKSISRDFNERKCWVHLNHGRRIRHAT